MLLIAVTGPVGSGKSTLLSTLATWWTTQGKRLDGIVAEAGGERIPGPGAAAYDHVWVATGERYRFAERDESRIPRYTFSHEAQERLARWAASLGEQSSAPLMLLDEFGHLEAGGGGLMAVWPEILRATPDIVVMAVREDVTEAIERGLGRRFDVRVDVRESDAWEHVRSACVEHADWSRVGVYGAGSGGVEVTIGSALHGAQVPLRGLMLSSAQAAVMAHAGEGLGRRARVVWVPFIAAGLKALSPAGSRLRPMMAITIQGLLFGGATSVFGWNVLGVGLGGAMVGMWATAQGFMLQYLLVGSDLLRAYDTLVEWVSQRWAFGLPGLLTMLAIWIGVWGLVSSVVTLSVWRRRALPARLRSMMDRSVRRVRIEPRRGGRAHAMLHAMRDISRPVFWLPVLLVVTILLVSGSPAERAFWVVGRAATIGFVLFSLVRLVDPPRFIEWLRSRGHWGPAVAFARALSTGSARHVDDEPER